MDSALSSPAATMVTEFGYCPQTPPIYAPVAQLDCSRVTIVEREASSLPSSPHKSVEGSSSPTRKRSRLFGTLRLLSSRYESIADENGSPKSLKKRKSIADLLTFSSSRSRKHDEQHVHPSSPNKRTDATSSPRKKVLQSASASRINRRKSLGDIWGSISSRVSPRRESTSHGHCPDWYEVDCERLTKLNDADETTSPSGAINAATGLTITSVVEATGGTSFTQPPSSIADSGAEVDAYHPQSFREHSVSSSLLWYEESARSPTPKFKDEDELKVTCCLTTNDKDEDQLKVICASTPSRKEEEPNVTGSSTPNNKNEDEPNVTGSSTPNNKDEDEPKAIYSSTPKDKGKQKIVKFSTPIDGQQVKTPDSYLNLLIDACEEPRAPDSYLQELLKAASVVTSARDSPCPRCDSYLKEQLLSVENNDLLYVQDQESSKDAENFSAPPPYTLNDLSKVKLGEVTYGGLRSRRQAPERPEDEIIITVREVSDESSERLSKIGSEFPLREGDRKERYEKLMRKSLPSRRSSDESIEKRVKLTVAKMTKNYHMVTSSEGSWEEAPSRGSEQYDFETDQMEVWDSIILGSRTLQEVCDPHYS
ncbi:hypothetical protein N431DRAFT_503556 [Stipitochalara longipes BDJ]|nr:hypothetical protein N431DRAFT_503556 [Stipitochalara longipes BDJ]